MKSDILVDAIGLINEEMVKEAKINEVRGFSQRPFRLSVKRAVVFIAAAVLCCTASVAALAAADVEPVYRLLYEMSPSAAQRLKPVRKSCVDNGIQMEVVSARIQDNTAEIYVAMRDLEGERIDASMDLFDSYFIRDSGDSSATCSFEGYDEETGTATFLILIEQMNEEKFSTNKVTFSVSQFLSHKNKYKGTLSEIDLSSADTAPETMTDVEPRGGSISDFQGKITFLRPETTNVYTPTEGVNVSAVGYIDEKLHIQIYYEDILKTDNHGWLKLRNAEGSIIECDASEAFWDDAQCGSYQEYIFDVPYESLGDYEVYGEFVTCNTLTEGSWQITFPMSDVHK